jgi:hypothetical protein
MQRRQSQFGRRKNAASPRRLASRLVMHDLSKDFFQRLADSRNDSLGLSEIACTPRTRERTHIEPPNATTEGTVLDVAAVRSLHQMFLLLDEWDRTMEINPSSKEKSCEECDIGDLHI